MDSLLTVRTTFPETPSDISDTMQAELCADTPAAAEVIFAHWQKLCFESVL